MEINSYTGSRKSNQLFLTSLENLQVEVHMNQFQILFAVVKEELLTEEPILGKRNHLNILSAAFQV